MSSISRLYPYTHTLRESLPIAILCRIDLPSTTEANFQIRAGAKRPPRAGQDHHLDALVEVDGAEHSLQAVAHALRVGIMLLGPIEGYDEDWSGRGRVGRMMAELDVSDWEGLVGGRNSDGIHCAVIQRVD